MEIEEKDKDSSKADDKEENIIDDLFENKKFLVGIRRPENSNSIQFHYSFYQFVEKPMIFFSLEEREGKHFIAYRVEGILDKAESEEASRKNIVESFAITAENAKKIRSSDLQYAENCFNFTRWKIISLGAEEIFEAIKMSIATRKRKKLEKANKRFLESKQKIEEEFKEIQSMEIISK